MWIKLQCEGKKAKTLQLQDSSQLSWNSAFVFYRAHPDKPINVQVMYQILFVLLCHGKKKKYFDLYPDVCISLFQLYSQKWQCFHTLVGQAELPAVINRSLSPLEVALRDKGGEPTATVLSLKVLTIDSILQC